MLDYRGCWIIEEDFGLKRMVDYRGCWIKEDVGLKRMLD